MLRLDASLCLYKLTDWSVTEVVNLESPTHPRQRRKEARPAELMAAALDLFVARGFAGTRLDDVAARAGVSKGCLLYTSRCV